MLTRLSTFFYGIALVTLPWTGVGLLKLSTGRDWGGGLQPSWLFLALAVLCTGLDRLWNRSPRSGRTMEIPPRLRRWWLLGSAAVLLSVLISIAGLWIAPSAESADATLGRFVKQFIQLAIMVVFIAWPALWTRGRRRWVWTVKWLLIGGVIQVAYGVLQGFCYYHPQTIFTWMDGIFTSNPSILSGSGELYLGDSFRHVPRLRGMVCEPLYLGNYLLFLFPLTFVPVWSVRTRRLLAAAFLILLMWTWSRGAWLGLAGQVVLALGMFISLGRGAGRDLTRYDTRKFKLVVIGAGALLAVLPLVGLVTGWEWLLFPYRRLAQTFSGQDWSNLTRFYSMQAAWRAFLLSPVVGIGWGQFGWHFPSLVDPMGLQSQFTWPVVNNFPLLILCETGLAGFLVFVAWGVGLVRAVGNRLFVLRGEGNSFPVENLLLATTVSVAGVWLQLLTFSQYNLPHIWISIGLLLAMLADGDSRP
ncbi:MAG: O-antigen ligase family protein [Candidatus Krumholzibacteria bacterium]|nr:O-antigen ligase family protein [Candidatus Krumholzibacteria bacterium]